MKKFTIIASPEYEHMILEELGTARFVQLKEVTGVDFEKFKETGERPQDFPSLYKKFHETYQSLEETGLIDQARADLSTAELRDFTDDPEGTVESYLKQLEEVKRKLDEAVANEEARRKERERRLLEARARLERVRALEPDELKRGLAVGLVDLQILERLVEHLQRFEDISYKVIEVSPEAGYIFIFGPEKRKGWIETLFLIFEVKDIFDVLSTGDVLLALDAEIREEVIKEYEEEVEKLQLLVEKEEEEDVIKDQIEKIQVLFEREEKDQSPPILGKAKFLDNVLRIMSHKRAPVLRTKVISVIQGWVPEEKLEDMNRIKEDLEEKTEELFFVQYEDPSHEDHAIPTLPPKIKPSFLQPAYTLTTLRGWPSIHEVNPSYITILIFSFQFGLMFGDIGQGAIFLLLGLLLTWKFKSGMASKIGVLFIPMGIASIIFGFLYGEVFLIEGLIHPILFSPLHNIGKLMKTILGIAVAEICISLVISSINHIKEGDFFGILGEHGVGAILFIVGLYLGGLTFLGGATIGELFSHWTFSMMLAGLVLATLVPLISAVFHKHVGIDVMGEMISALMMTFVESLASFFSFLRIAAFALAHASLAIAAHALSNSMGPAIGLLMTNAIAMTFEFMSSSVQSLRLLYYEFMSRFFHGGGAPFRPFRIRNRSKQVA